MFPWFVLLMERCTLFLICAAGEHVVLICSLPLRAEGYLSAGNLYVHRQQYRRLVSARLYSVRDHLAMWLWCLLDMWYWTDCRL